MANQLTVANIHSILTLHERGYSFRAIAKMLGVDRETVANHVKRAYPPGSPGQAEPKPASAAEAPTGDFSEKTAVFAVGADSKPARDGRFAAASPGAPAPLGNEAPAGDSQAGCPGLSAWGASPSPGGAPQTPRLALGRGGGGDACDLPAAPGNPTAPAAAAQSPRSPSHCEPFRDQILLALQRGLSATRIWQDLREQHGDDTGGGGAATAPGYYSVRRYVRTLQDVPEPPFRRMECEPGAEAQVDFGTGAPVIDRQGKKRGTHVLRIVLSHSRKGYSESVFRQTTEEFIRCLENAFHHFGGVPQTLVLDNLRAAVSKADWFDPEINPKVQSFCQHYGIVPLPTKPRMPRHKGKVENGVGYTKGNGLKGHEFDSLQEENEHLLRWETTIADLRIHGTTKRQVKEMFEQVERPALQPLPGARFPSFTEGQRIVSRDGHIEVAKAYYSVPPEYLGRTVWARWDARTVRIFDSRMQQIALHVRSEPGRFRTDHRHILDRKISGVERGATWLLQKAEHIGTEAARWAQAMVTERGIEGVRVLQGLVSLANKHPGEQVNRACEIALSHGAFRLRTIRQLIKRNANCSDEQGELPGFIDEHPIIRSLADYGRLVHHAFTTQGAHA